MSDLPISETHFRLLQSYGRNKLLRRLGEKERLELWRLTCESAGVPHVPRDAVVDRWKAFVSGESRDSSIAVNGDIDPAYVTVGITFREKLVAAHTTRTPALLRRLLRIFRKAHPDEAAYLEAVRELAVSALEPSKRRD